LEAWIIKDRVWVPGVESRKMEDRLAVKMMALHPQTGEVMETLPAGPIFNTGHHRRCYPGKATDRFFIFSRRGAEFLSLDTAEPTMNNWTRGTCGYGVMPCNGLLYSPPHSCRCYSETALRGMHALAPQTRGPDLAAFIDADKTQRLQKGPAYNQVEPITQQADYDWPTYRHDNARSGATAASVASTIKQKWEAQCNGPLSAPVLANGMLYLAQTDAHQIHAFDAANGQIQWSFTAGGRIDTPPTIYKGYAIFGCRDGWVYALRANDGELAWRYRAAPTDLRLGAFGQVESVWPVHGSVLVQEDTVYCAAGRNSFIDGGLYLYGLNYKTGEVTYLHHYYGPDTDAGMTRENPNPGFVMPGALPDILVGDEGNIFMRHIVFDPKLQSDKNMNPNLYIAPERTRENFGGDHKYWCDLLEVGPKAFVGKPEWYHRSYFNNFPGQRLYSTIGLLDDSWHIRSYWSYGQIVGQYIVFDGDTGYAVRAYPNAARWLTYKSGEGYELYAGKTTKPTPGERHYALQAKDHRWNITIPFRPKAMLLAGETLWLCGTPDRAKPDEALAALNGEYGAQLHAIDATSGELLAEYHLDALPVYDGLIASDGTLYCTLQNGDLLCFQED
jgi:outer membrane protein assembly factor BamB